METGREMGKEAGKGRNGGAGEGGARAKPGNQLIYRGEWCYLSQSPS